MECQLEKKLLKDNKGIIAIEVLISFVGFMIFTLLIVTFINIASIQLRFHHALTQTAHEVAFYSQVLQMFGVVDAMRGVERLSAETRGELDGAIDSVFGVMDDMNSLFESAVNLDAGGAVEAFGSAANNAETGWEILSGWIDNPFGFVRGFIWVAASEGIGIGMSTLRLGE